MVSCAWNAQKQCIEVTFSPGKDFLDIADGVVGETFQFRIIHNVISRLGRRISGSDTAWSITVSPDAVYRDVNYDNAIVTTAVNFSPTVTTSVSCQWFDYADSPSDITLSNSPYYNSASALNDRQIKISAYSFRAYEGIYNAYIRDNRNNPYYVNGQVQYNQWIPTYDGGLDDNIYELRIS